MGPSKLYVEGEYELSPSGETHIEAKYEMEGAKSLWLTESFYGNGWDPTAGDFLLEGDWDKKNLSSCGGKAVFKGFFKIKAKSNDKFASEILIDRKERENLSVWGWNYETCYKRPAYCSGIAGDPELEHVYPECHK